MKMTKRTIQGLVEKVISEFTRGYYEIRVKVGNTVYSIKLQDYKIDYEIIHRLAMIPKKSIRINGILDPETKEIKEPEDFWVKLY